MFPVDGVIVCREVGGLVDVRLSFKVGDRVGMDETSLVNDGNIVDGTDNGNSVGDSVTVTVTGGAVESTGTAVGTVWMNGTVGLPDGVLAVALK